MDSLKPRILIADDEKEIRLAIRYALQLEGYEMTDAVNGQDALEQLQAKEFDLLLLDLYIPDLDSMEVLSEVVERYPNVYVVVVTTHGGGEHVADAVKAGAVDYLQQPFTPQEIRTLVAQVLDRQRDVQQQADDYATHLELSRQNINEQHLDAATEHVRQAIAGDPARPEAFNLMGVLDEMRGDHHAAMSNYRIALNLDPTYAPARENLQNSSGLAGRKPNSFNLG